MSEPAPASPESGRIALVLTRITMAAVLGALVFGIGVSVYMTMHHEITVYGGESVQFQLVGCAEAAGVSCDVVNTSEWSEIFGVPTFTWAIPTYIALGGLAVLAMLGRRSALWLLALGGVGISAFSGFLYYISVVEIGSVCLWCMRLYAVNGGVLVAALVALLPVLGARVPGMPTVREIGIGGGIFLGATVLSVGVQQAWRATLLGDAPSSGDLLAEAVVDVPDDPLAFVDPKGELEPRRIEVARTEDGNSAELVIRPTDAWKGNLDAEVTLVEFADLECGYCKRASVELSQLYKAYGDRVLFVFKHYPMDRACNPGVKSRKHRDACNAAVAAVCAQEQGRFWAYHDLAFKNQHALDVPALIQYAETLDLDMGTWRACVTSEQARARVRQSGQDGAALDVHGTPRIFIDGRLYRAGSSARQLAKALETALGMSGAEAAARMRSIGAIDAEPVEPIAEDVPEMTRVTYGDLDFEIDTFEASLQDGAAFSGKHEIPALRMSWYAARDACEAAGKRMCTEQEWLAACQGAEPVDDDGDGAFADDRIEGTAYPYGDLHLPPRCWSARNPETHRPVYTGEMPGCTGADKVYDLVGNVEEWVGDSAERAVLLGGAYDTRSDKARCYRRNDTFGAGYANRRTGFRCCRTPSDSGVDGATDAPAVP